MANERATLEPLARTYISRRVARGELSALAGRDYTYRLIQFANTYGGRPIDKLGPKAIDAWRETIAHLAPATQRQHLSNVRAFCQWLQAEGVIRKDPTSHVPCIHQPRRAPVTFTEAEVARLLAAAPNRRATAVLWLMVGCGARCCEVARLRIEDYDPVGATVRLTGKGGHERILPVPAEVAHAVDAYLDEIGRVAGPLIRSELEPWKGVAPATLSHYVRGWLKCAGVKARPLDGRSAHGLRRTCASDVMDRSGDIRAVQAMLGHASVETTARHYLRDATIGQLREAMAGRDYSAPCGPAHLNA